jgi:LysM repeat protein
MGYKTAVLLGLLPQLLSASVVCSFSVAANNGDTCQSFASTWGQSVEDFEALNPGVSCPNLTAGQSYCVIGTVSNDPEPTTTSTTLKTTTSTTTTSSSPYQPTQPGLVANCDQFHLVASGDQCDTIEAKYGITDAQFKAWNPSINARMSDPIPFLPV